VGLSGHFAQEQALARVYGMLVTQAQAISYVDVYWLLAAVSALMFFLSFLLAKNEPGAGAGEISIH
jgi:DHA2 family multidrug resistance protein